MGYLLAQVGRSSRNSPGKSRFYWALTPVVPACAQVTESGNDLFPPVFRAGITAGTTGGRWMRFHTAQTT